MFVFTVWDQAAPPAHVVQSSHAEIPLKAKKQTKRSEEQRGSRQTPVAQNVPRPVCSTLTAGAEPRIAWLSRSMRTGWLLRCV